MVVLNHTNVTNLTHGGVELHNSISVNFHSTSCGSNKSVSLFIYDVADVS